MKVAIMQPYFFPYVGYFQLIHHVDTYVVYDDVNFIKKGWINRNRIIVNAKPSYITLELERASQNKKINEITIGKNRKELLTTIIQSYRKAPYFGPVIELLERSFNNSEISLSRYVEESLKNVCAYLNIGAFFSRSSDLAKNNLLKGEAKIIEICKVTGADVYINPIGGISLYDKEEFKKHDIELHFLRSLPRKYRQFQEGFIGDLSIINVMMFNSAEEIGRMLYECELL